MLFPAATTQVLCNGRLLPCTGTADGCALDLDAGEQGWSDEVVLCQAVADDPVLAPLAPLVFKAGLPIWTPNLDRGGVVRVDARATAVGTAFLSPYLTALYPETARALLGLTADSPYLDALAAAVHAGDREVAQAAVGPVVVDVLAQGTVSEALTDASKDLGMDHVEVQQTGGYVALDSRLGASVDHVCAVYALDECGVASEQGLFEASGADVFAKTSLGRTYVPAKSYFKLQNLALAALEHLVGDLLPRRELETFRLEPGRVHDIQCYSGAVGLADGDDARLDAALVDAEPEGRALRNAALLANLVSLATETLRVFVDFDAFGRDGRDISQAIAICTQDAVGPAFEAFDGGDREAWFDLLRTIQGCAIKRLGVVLAKRGLYAVAAWVLDFAADGGTGWVSRITRVGMVLDRVVGMVALASPVERQLLAYQVDFEACAGCADRCPEAGARRCEGGVSYRVCDVSEDGCLDWGEPVGCGEGLVCEGADDDAQCLPCQGDECDEPACEDECEPGETRCAGDDAVETCGSCDADRCRDWCEPVACEPHLLCVEGACTCDDDDDLPDAFPGAALEALDDSGVSAIVETRLAAEGDVDVVHAYVADERGDTLLPSVQVDGARAGVRYDLCLAWACDPLVNGGEVSGLDCGDAVRTTRDGLPACCALGQTGGARVELDVSCTVGGLSNDSGTAYVYLEAIQGAQCWPPIRLTVTGGHD